MPARDTTHVNTAEFVFQLIPDHYANVAIWSTRALIVNEVK
jgi:hypothetical protein